MKKHRTRRLSKEEATLVHRGVLFELKKMEGKRWIPFDEIKKSLKCK